jgi:hypothetical protein
VGKIFKLSEQFSGGLSPIFTSIHLSGSVTMQADDKPLNSEIGWKNYLYNPIHFINLNSQDFGHRLTNRAKGNNFLVKDLFSPSRLSVFIQVIPVVFMFGFAHKPHAFL